MPYRRLPNTDSARLRAFKKAIEMSKEIPPFRLAFSMKTLVKIQAFLPLFENAISHQRQTMVNQSEKAKVNQETTRKARLYLTHFLKVMNMAIMRTLRVLLYTMASNLERYNPTMKASTRTTSVI